MPIIITTTEDGIAESIKKSAPDGARVSIRYPDVPSGGRMVRSAPIITVTIHFLRDHAGNIGEALFASWLYDIIKGKACQIFHREKNIAPKPGVIRRAIQEEFEFVENQNESDDA